MVRRDFPAVVVDEETSVSFRPWSVRVSVLAQLWATCVSRDEQLLDHMMSFIDPCGLASLSRLDRAFNAILRGYFQRMFTIDRLLAPFLSFVDDFREVQSRTGALISGSTALQLFDRAHYAGADLDVYVGCPHALDLATYLREREHYEFRPQPSQRSTPEDALAMAFVHPTLYGYYKLAGIVGVLNFVHNDKKIQIIVARHSPLDVILNFHSSMSHSIGSGSDHALITLAACVMNVITHSMAYCLFPRLTVVGRLSCTFIRPFVERYSTGVALQKYAGRGFSFVSSLPDADGSSGGIVERWVGDRYTWAAPLAPGLRQLPKDILSVNGFRLTIARRTGCSIEYDHFKGPGLRFEYITSASERFLLRTAWEAHVTRPRTASTDEWSVCRMNVSVAFELIIDVEWSSVASDHPLSEALYTLRTALATGRVEVISSTAQIASTLEFWLGGRSRLS